MWSFCFADRSLTKLRNDIDLASPSPDGSHIAFAAQSAVWMMSSDGTNAIRLFSLEKGYGLEEMAWSPDGRRLAYMKSHGEYDEVTIESRAITGGNAVVVISNPRLRSFAWSSDGRIFYSQLESSKEASSNIWEVAIDTSTWRPSGVPQKLTNWAGFSLWSVTTTADGKRVSFVRKSDQSDVYLGALNTRGSRLDTPLRLTQDDRMDWLGGWARQGKTLLFFSDRNADFDIFEQNAGSSAPTEIVAGRAEEKRNPQLSPDSRWILYLAWPNQRGDELPTSGRLMRVPVSGGTPELVVDVNGYPGSARTPRDRWLPTARGYPDFRCPSLPNPGLACVLAEVKGERLSFSAVDPVQGRRGELATIEADPIDSFWDLSPDGTRVALGNCESGDSHIRVLELANNKEIQVTVKGWSCLTSADWAPDGQNFFASTWASKGGSLLHITLTGQTKLLYRAAGMSLEKPMASPNGRSLAYSEVTTIGNAWMLEAP
jgi:Tol biopolymer transport system component